MDDENKFLFSQKIQTLEAFAEFFCALFAASHPEITVEIMRGQNAIGLALMTGEKILSPMVRLDGLYDKYIGGYSLWKVFCEISSACDEYDSRNSTGIVAAIEDFELVREDILMAMEYTEFTPAQVGALLGSPAPLADVYRLWEKRESGHMEEIISTVEGCADALIRGSSG